MLSIAVVTMLASCSANDDRNVATESGKAENVKQLVSEYSGADIPDQTASITSHELIVTNSDESQVIYELPEDEFFISIAPYKDATHP